MHNEAQNTIGNIFENVTKRYGYESVSAGFVNPEVA